MQKINTLGVLTAALLTTSGAWAAESSDPIKLTLQGLLQDRGGLSSSGFSATNAVTLCVE